MRILLCSHWFSPSFGGVETVSKILAEQWTSAGCEVVVVTETAGPREETAYEVVRRPGLGELRRLGVWADVVVQNIVSLRTLLPLAFSRKPTVVIHGSWLRKSDGSVGWQNRLKRMAIQRVQNVAISASVAESLGVRSVTIGNPFDAREFTRSAEDVRSEDVVFLGRLVSDKGVDLLLRAVHQLGEEGMRPSVTIIGDGPDMAMLRELAEELGVTAQVRFAGTLREGRGRELARHKMMVIPSRWAEPFGVVALEGIASGCAIVASASGGLTEAAGDCGIFFPNGEVGAMASAMRRVLSEPDVYARLVAAGPVHLKNYQPDVVAKKYLDMFGELIAGSGKGAPEPRVTSDAAGKVA